MLGFTRMTFSWIFNLFFFHFMTVMGLKAIDDMHHWKKRCFSTVMLHVAFWVILVAGFFGSGDKVRVKVVAHVGQPVQIGITENGERVELPFALRLKKFVLEEYPPRIHRVNENTLSEQFVEINEKGSKGMLDVWKVECLEYMEMAGRLHEDSAYTVMKHVGAVMAVYVRASHCDTHEEVEGWISCGSHIFNGSTLELPDGTVLVMPRREVRKYLSVVELDTSEKQKQLEIAVNHPADVGAWRIYQSGYDSSRGRWSTTSVLECVKDAWYLPVHIALWLIVLAGCWMLWSGWKTGRKGERR